MIGELVSFSMGAFADLRLVPDMTLTLKKTILTLKLGGSVHLPQRGHVLLFLCYVPIRVRVILLKVVSGTIP